MPTPKQFATYDAAFEVLHKLEREYYLLLRRAYMQEPGAYDKLEEVENELKELRRLFDRSGKPFRR